MVDKTARVGRNPQTDEELIISSAKGDDLQTIKHAAKRSVNHRGQSK